MLNYLKTSVRLNMAHFDMMCYKIVLLFLLMMCFLDNFGHCRPQELYQPTTSRTTTSATYIRLGRSTSNFRTIPPVSNSSSSLTGKDTYALINAPRNCEDGKEFDHEGNCVTTFFNKPLVKPSQNQPQSNKNKPKSGSNTRRN